MRKRSLLYPTIETSERVNIVHEHMHTPLCLFFLCLLNSKFCRPWNKKSCPGGISVKTCYQKVFETTEDHILPKFESGFVDTQCSNSLHKHSKLLGNIQDNQFLEEYMYILHVYSYTCICLFVNCLLLFHCFLIALCNFISHISF